MKKFRFEPWEDYKNMSTDIIDIKEPPCKYCKFFRPRIITDSRGKFNGVCLCIKDDMYHDFSCFMIKEEDK